MALSEEEKAKRRARYKERREEVLAYQKRWRSENEDKVAEYQYKVWKKKAEKKRRI